MANLAPDLDPVARALLRAQEREPAELTAEERAELEEAKQAVRRGDYVSSEELCRQLGLTSVRE